MKDFFSNLFSPRRAYLDHAALTPVDPQVAAALTEALVTVASQGNPSSVHAEGRAAKTLLENARRSIASLLGVQADEVIFTSGATESDNIALQGTVAAAPFKRPRVITTAIEHPAIRETLSALEDGGVDVVYLSVDKNGIISLDDLRAALTRDTVLVTLSYGNSELGTLQPAREIGRIVRQWRKTKDAERQFPYLHLDASQSAYFLPVGLDALQADLVTFDGSKLYGPPGSGVLCLRRGLDLKPVSYGGSQERDLRPGTQNVPVAVGLAKALELAKKRRDEESARLNKLSDRFVGLLRERIPNVLIQGEKGPRLPHFVSVCVPHMDAEFMVVKLDLAGIAVSTGSACRSIGGQGFSPIIAALPNGAQCAAHTIRFSLGRSTRVPDIDRAAEVFSNLVKGI